MISHQNFSTAYTIINKVSSDESSRFSIIPVKDNPADFETTFITTNPNNEEWKNKACENTNQAGIHIGIPFICDPSDNAGQKGNNNQQDQDISDRVNEKVGNLKEKLNDSIFGNNENDNFQSNDLQSNSKDDHNKNGKDNTNDGNDNNNQNYEDNDNKNNDKRNKFYEQQHSGQQGEDKAKSKLDDTNGNNGNDQGNNNNNNDLGIAGLDLGLNIDKKLDRVDEKIDNLKNKITSGNDNNHLFGQQQKNEDNEKIKNDQDNDDETLGINGLATNIQNIQVNLEKKIEKLRDKFENERDNQRLIDQRNEFDDDDDDDTNDGNDNSDDGDGKDYDGYGFKGDDSNGKRNENGEENFNFAAAGDFGCSTNTQNTVENMQSKDPEIVLALGDLSYHSTADCWFDMMSPIKDKLMITLGYHDVEDGPAKMNQYLNSFDMEKPFYSYDYNKVHFLVMSAKSVYDEGSEQYNFVLEDLKKASENENVNWIVVSSYGPPYTSPSEHTAFKKLREVYHPIFEKYGVDLVLGGHNHNYQRTYPLTYNPNDSGQPIVTSTSTADYDGQKNGVVFAIVGTGGVNLYSFDGQAPFVDTQFANKFGFLNIDITNGNPHTKLTGTFYDNKGSQILDQFTIKKELKDKNSQVISS